MRVDEMSTGQLVELLTEDALDHDPGYEMVRVRLGVLAEVARRVTPGREEAAQTTGP